MLKWKFTINHYLSVYTSVLCVCLRMHIIQQQQQQQNRTQMNLFSKWMTSHLINDSERYLMRFMLFFFSLPFDVCSRWNFLLPNELRVAQAKHGKGAVKTAGTCAYDAYRLICYNTIILIVLRVCVCEATGVTSAPHISIGFCDVIFVLITPGVLLWPVFLLQIGRWISMWPSTENDYFCTAHKADDFLEKIPQKWKRKNA